MNRSFLLFTGAASALTFGTVLLAPLPQVVAIRAPLISTSVYYSGCREARAAGVAPIYRGQPGYRPEMDGDDDGIACEPYRKR